MGKYSIWVLDYAAVNQFPQSLMLGGLTGSPRLCLPFLSWTVGNPPYSKGTFFRQSNTMM